LPGQGDFAMQFRNTPLAAALGFGFIAGAQAQTQPAQSMSPVVVTATPLGSDLFELAAPVNVLQGQGLRYKQQTTLGETTANEVGVSSTYFGPNASRPVIRGLGSFDIRVLSNGLGILDASAASPDHAVAVSPYAVDRVEVVRGPATIMYGSSAIGGVVNTIDGRIAQEGLVKPVNGAADYRYDTANSLQAGGARLDVGNSAFVLHLDGYKTNNHDLKIPGSAWTSSVQIQRGDPGPSGQLPNSQGDSDTYGIGGSFMLGDRGYAGLSYSEFNTNYGTVAEPDVTIKLRRQAWNFAGELRDTVPGLKALRVKYGYNDYQHTEFEGGVAGTVFKSKGYNLRVEGLHQAIGPVVGAVGLELVDFDFSALGDEAFVPSTKTSSVAGFLYEELPYGPWKFSFGGRVAGDKVEAKAFPQAGLPAASRNFTPWSLAVGALYAFTREWALAANLSYTQRSPTFQELYADGPHLATDQFVVGNPNLGIVKSTGIDLTLRQQSRLVTGSIGAFYNDFSNFIALLPTGIFRLPDRSVVPAGTPDSLEQFNYAQVKARFYGFEGQVSFPIWERAGKAVTLGMQADYVNARDTSNGQPLPFIPPLRFGATLGYQQEAFQTGLGGMFAAAQNQVPQFGTTTPGYANVFANASYRFKLASGPSLELFVQGNNLLDQTIRYSTSPLKDIAPLGARAVIAGIRGAL
jgi:iron complex outermembrane recepter protein